MPSEVQATRATQKPSLLVLGYTSDITGSSVALSRLLSSIEKIIPFIVASRPRSYLLEEARKHGWSYVSINVPLLTLSLSPFRYIKVLLQSLSMSLKFRRLVGENNITLCLVNCAPNLGWLPGYWLLPKSRRPKVAWLVHELVLYPPVIYKAIQFIVKKSSSVVFGVSEAVCEIYPNKATLLPNIIPPVKNDQIGNPFEEKALHLLWIGTAAPRKGLHLLPHKIKSLRQMGGLFNWSW